MHFRPVGRKNRTSDDLYPCCCRSAFLLRPDELLPADLLYPARSGWQPWQLCTVNRPLPARRIDCFACGSPVYPGRFDTSVDQTSAPHTTTQAHSGVSPTDARKVAHFTGRSVCTSARLQHLPQARLNGSQAVAFIRLPPNPRHLLVVEATNALRSKGNPGLRR
jgi:hypothetical protein